MNYIRHLNAFFNLIKSDTRLTTSHMSLYMALFHYWNFNRFHNPFSIYRENIMQLSKIGSKNTYHKCIKELHQAKYIFYHPAPSKFQVVRISIVRLDTEPEPQTRYKQLDLFGTDIDTGNVPKLRPHSTDFDTVPVSKMGHLIKQTNKQRETPTHKIFKKNDKIQKAVNDMAAGVSIVGHNESPVEIPPLDEIQHHFFNHNYPSEEAIKFYNHYKALDWRIQGKTPITNWKPLVEKWMQNAKRWQMSSAGGGGLLSEAKQDGGGQKRDIQFLFESFSQGKKIFHHITTQHFEQLNLSLDDETLQQARQERINEVTGTNQHSLNQLWAAYLKGDESNDLIQKDKHNVTALAKRIAVIKYFQQQKLKQQ